MLVKPEFLRCIESSADGPSPSPALVAIVGPTASGKTALAVEIAERLDTEIISADSMQFYRGMEIGTGAPTREELARVKHHFVGFLNPSEDFSAGAFEIEAGRIARALNAQGKPAVVVGGSGLYISALIDGLFSGPGKAPAIRSRLRREAEEMGVPVLFARLQGADPEYAATINGGDLRRIVRALEVFELTGRPLSALHREHRASAKPMDAAQLGLNLDRGYLYGRIDRRVDAMVQEGLVDEVRALIEGGHGPDIERLRSLGYREMAAFVRSECSLKEAIELMKRNTRRYAKRQLSWFRSDPRIRWIDVPDGATMPDLVERAMALTYPDTRQ